MSIASYAVKVNSAGCHHCPHYTLTVFVRTVVRPPTVLRVVTVAVRPLTRTRDDTLTGTRLMRIAIYLSSFVPYLGLWPSPIANSHKVQAAAIPAETVLNKRNGAETKFLALG